MMLELTIEHGMARRTVKSLDALKERYMKGQTDTVDEIVRLLNLLADLYPRHIDKEDRQFFYPCMSYFPPQEQESMLADFLEFDRDYTNRRYREIVARIEGQPI